MNKILATIAVGSLMAIAVPGVASAKDGGGGGVKVKGMCTATSTSKLQAKADDGRIETEFEVDQHVTGQTWKVTISDNGTVVAHAKKTVVAPADSFTVRKRIANLAGTDTIMATATNKATGETCTATASI